MYCAVVCQAPETGWVGGWVRRVRTEEVWGALGKGANECHCNAVRGGAKNTR